MDPSPAEREGTSWSKGLESADLAVTGPRRRGPDRSGAVVSIPPSLDLSLGPTLAGARQTALSAG